MPALPPESEPAIVSAVGGAVPTAASEPSALVGEAALTGASAEAAGFTGAAGLAAAPELAGVVASTGAASAAGAVLRSESFSRSPEVSRIALMLRRPAPHPVPAESQLTGAERGRGSRGRTPGRLRLEPFQRAQFS
ncbi:hypothetical protein GCM10027174_05510 [Salinifilum aidingensis]